jgi:hypothetical protein
MHILFINGDNLILFLDFIKRYDFKSKCFHLVNVFIQIDMKFFEMILLVVLNKHLIMELINNMKLLYMY